MTIFDQFFKEIREGEGCGHNEMVPNTGNPKYPESEYAWKCAKCGYIYGSANDETGPIPKKESVTEASTRDLNASATHGGYPSTGFFDKGFKLGDILMQPAHPEYGKFKVTRERDYGYEVTRVGARSAADSMVLLHGEEKFWKLAEAKLREEEEDEPQEDDIHTEDYEHWYMSGKLYFTGEAAGLKKKMDADGYWPNVWWWSDHGNSLLLSDKKDWWK